MKTLQGLALAIGMTVALSVPAHAVTTWNFGGSGGVLGTTQAFTATDTVTQLTAAGFLFAGGTPLPLHQNLKGLGIVGGCTNDISACGAVEFLRLEFGSAAWDPVSITFENIGDTTNAGDAWVVFGDNDGNISNGATLLASGDATGNVNRQLTVLFAGVTPFQFLYIMPAAGAPGSDFRVSQVVGELPEPGTLLLLGTGLLALSGVARRRRSS
jgi:hypothetical protein